ncbi:TFIIB transcription factor [Quillaja saponaria]|uniref:TFIIB transcription factor n=1 Tax=Quillaja saponaria TaxID=32244 RepID=A0AAD7P9H4_QUISA|nr:TFIIB transcription factor [Quillaja saponaria]
MASSSSCNNCGKNSLIRDDVSGDLLCSSCGVVQGFDNYDAQLGGLSGPQGTFIRVGTVGRGSVYSYKETKLYEAHKSIDEFMFRLGLLGSKTNDVKTMISTITEGEFGQGDWFQVLIGACAYVVMRKDNRSLPMAEVADAIGCDVYELGVESSIVDRMRKQGIFLIQCAIKWFLTTGRRPLPVVVAVLVLVAELNQVEVRVEDLAKEVHAKVSTCRTRYKELLEELVKVAQVLPWGKDVTSKNIVNNAPFVIQYMEKKSMSESADKRNHTLYNLEEIVSECLCKDVEYEHGTDIISYEKDSQYFSLGDTAGITRTGIKDVDKLKISHECLSIMYEKFLNESEHAKNSRGRGMAHKRKRMEKLDLYACREWWDGKSELSKKLLLKELLQQDVGFDTMPPSFIAGCLKSKRRREKIRSAKQRIQRIMHPDNADWSDSGSGCLLDEVQPGKKKKKRKGMLVNDVSWEDLIIETLLLHQVKEEEIEKGHYNTLLDLYVFNSGVV